MKFLSQNLNFRNGFDPMRIESILHRIELALKHQTSNFGLNMIIVSIILKNTSVYLTAKTSRNKLSSKMGWSKFLLRFFKYSHSVWTLHFDAFRLSYIRGIKTKTHSIHFHWINKSKDFGWVGKYWLLTMWKILIMKKRVQHLIYCLSKSSQVISVYSTIVKTEALVKGQRFVWYQPKTRWGLLCEMFFYENMLCDPNIKKYAGSSITLFIF